MFHSIVYRFVSLHFYVQLDLVRLYVNFLESGLAISQNDVGIYVLSFLSINALLKPSSNECLLS